MTNNKSKVHPYLIAANWAPEGSCVFWKKETHVIAKYEQMQKELKIAVRLLINKGSEKSSRAGESAFSLT